MITRQIEKDLNDLQKEKFLFRVCMQALQPDPLHLTVSQWADENRVLSTKSSSEPGKWRTDRTPYLREIMDCLSSNNQIQQVVFMKGAQVGAALDIETDILTINGWRKMKDIQVNDFVFGADGKPAKVSFVSEIMQNHKCYKVNFSDGNFIIADAEHRWLVNENKKSKKQKVLITEDLRKQIKIKNRYKFSITNTKPLIYKKNNFKIHPYVLGYWLGDGHNSSNRITTQKDDAVIINEIFNKLGERSEIIDKFCKGYCSEIVIKKSDNECLRGHKKENNLNNFARCKLCLDDKNDKKYIPFGVRLKNLNLLKNKHIPRKYLETDFENRLELLMGLMDSDGYISKKSFCELSTVSKELKNDYVELICGLGMKPKVILKKSKIKTLNNRNFISKEYYKISFKPIYQIFKLPRKKIRYIEPKTISETLERKIISIDEYKSVPVKCIQVENQDHLYLAGKFLIPTHNTEMGNNWLGYIVDMAPGPAMMVQPTVDMLRRLTRQRLDPMFIETPCLKEKVMDKKSRDSANTIFMKEFPGGLLLLAGANSPTGLRSAPIRYLFLDEVDAYPEDCGGEGSPIKLAEARTRTFTRNKKIFIVSTPTIQQTSQIEPLFNDSDQRFYFIPCPFCGKKQKLVFDNLRWEKGKYDQVYYSCKYCGEAISEGHKNTFLAEGEWVPTVETKNKKARGYHLNSLYSPLGWYSWSDIARDWDESQGNILKLKYFVNTVLGECWIERGESPDWERLYRLKANYLRGTVPNGVLLLTAGVDIQRDRIEMEIVGWGQNMQSWSIDYIRIDGDTTQPEVWAKLSKEINRIYSSNDGLSFKLDKIAIDSGDNTQIVYNWVRAQSDNRIIAVKGRAAGVVMVEIPRIVDMRKDGKRIYRGMKYFPVSTNLVKEELYSFLKLDPPINDDDGYPRGYCMFPTNYDTEYFKMLTAEEKRRVTRGGVSSFSWEKIRERNEALDCRVYARAAAYVFGIDRFDDEDFSVLESTLQNRKHNASLPSQQVNRKKSDFW